LDGTHFWAALRYVERNPVRAGIVEVPEAYEWSSAAGHCGLREDRLLIPLPAFPSFVANWRRWIGGEDNADDTRSIRSNTKTGFPCGSAEFVKKLEEVLGVKLRQRKSKDTHAKKAEGEDLLPFWDKDK
jgi:putative transposase